MTFAIEQSFPFESTYSDATVTGAIMELGVKDGPNTLTPARADEVVNYWRSTTADLLGDSAVMDSAAARAAYAKLAVNHAGLFVRRNYPNQAEQTFRLAGELCPWMPEVVFQHVQLLVGQGRVDDALSVVNRAIQSAPEGESIAPFQGLADQLKGPKQFHESQAR